MYTMVRIYQIFETVCGSVHLALSNMDTDQVRQCINRRVDALLVSRPDGSYAPKCCTVCDRLVSPVNFTTMSLDFLSKHGSVLKMYTWNAVSDSLRECYKFTTDDPAIRELVGGMFLSPRGVYYTQQGVINRNVQEGFTVCKPCKKSLQSDRVPHYAIANNYCFGNPPLCLTELNDVELALLTPVKAYGYCFSWTGGQVPQRNLKGFLSYYKIDVESIVRTTAHFDVLGLNDNIVILFFGNMTEQQRHRARRRCKVRPDYVIRAMHWLLANNEEWAQKDINFEEVRASLINSGPVIIDNSENVPDAENENNVEQTESFQVFFPDGTLSGETGGQGKIQQFKELIALATKNGYDLELKANLLKEACKDYDKNNLVNACLLQFPYGRGGLNERRMNPDGSFTSSTDCLDFAQACSTNSQSHFHHELFVLILYNMVVKREMVRTAAFRSRNKANATQLATELTEEMVEEAINARANGSSYSRRPTAGDNYLKGVDAIAKSVPHTNEAAKRARQDGHGLQHEFGLSSVFLTFCPDDDNSFFLQMFSGVLIDDETPVSNLTDEQLLKRAKQRTELRIKNPGLCALFFEFVLEIIIEEVIGWNMKDGKARERGGLFGMPEAFVFAIEEQGRRTLHGHAQVWIRNFNGTRENLHSLNRNVRRESERAIKELVDRTSSSRLVKFANRRNLQDTFDHVCEVQDKRRRRQPQIVDDQQLRNLRHCHGQKQNNGVFAVCPHCTIGKWTAPQVLEVFLTKHKKVPNLSYFPDNNGPRRLKAMCVEYQKPGTVAPVDGTIVDAAYNLHQHSRASCFKKTLTSPNVITTDPSNPNYRKRKRSNIIHAECRYHFPARKKPHTVIQDASDTEIQWHSWDGSFTLRKIKEICIERHEYDAFQNVSCPAISHSKVPQNSNVSVVMTGPVGQYQFKYNLKGTQEDDEREYSVVKSACAKTLSTIKHQSCHSETTRRLLSAAFAHQKTNIIGGPLASYLTRHRTRFIFSHSFQWCPLRDLKELLDGRTVGTTISYHGHTPFYVNLAMHYLCRPSELENTNPYDFYSLYEVVRVTSHNEDAVMSFKNTVHFQHPSYMPRKDKFVQGVRLRNDRRLLKIVQYDFCDTGEFGGCITNPRTPISLASETYSQHVLMLFGSYRCIGDIKNGSYYYTDALRQFVTAGKLLPKMRRFLQNVQDCKSNSFRVGEIEDDLQRETELYMPSDLAFDLCEQQQDDEQNQTTAAADGMALDDLLRLLGSDESGENAAQNVSTHGSDFSLRAIRDKGVLQCGYKSLASLPMSVQTMSNSVVHSVGDMNNVPDPHTQQNDEECPRERKPTAKDIINVILTKKSVVSQSFEDITGKQDDHVDILEASGSVESILNWGAASGMDKDQQRAFEIFTATFVLTFFLHAENSVCRGSSATFRREKRRLEVMADVENRKSAQVICMLHGPGGCGKSTVIKLLVLYAKQYCEYLENFKFSSRTILLTALTGVAATLLRGGTVHGECHLNQTSQITPEQIELWEETRMLVVDEVSFASKRIFQELHNKLSRLREKISHKYGGLHVIFAGDFRQLEPPGKFDVPVYQDHCLEFQDWVNCYITLNGKYRFKNDPAYGELCLRFRDGTVTTDDINMLNDSCLVNGSTVLPEGIQYATYENRDRDAINTALFEKRCTECKEKYGAINDSVLVLSDNIKVRNGNKQYVPFGNPMYFWKHCGENEICLSQGRGRLDPVLKLYRDGPFMLTTNVEVGNGLANGTRAYFKQLLLKAGRSSFTLKLDSGVEVKAVYASDVMHIVMEHSIKDITPSTFHIKPAEYTFHAKMLKPLALQTKKQEREKIQMKCTQLQVISTDATTGHKLQGRGVETLFVHNWSYTANWVYVMLSRVKTMKGLYMRRKLSTDLCKYAMKEPLKRMLASFDDRRPKYYTDEQYAELFR